MTPEIASKIDSISVALNAGGMNTVNIVLAFIMYGVALGIKPRTFVDLFKRPKPIFAGMLSQLVFLPLLTFLLTLAFGRSITWTMAIGMILVASCPGGNISNFMSSLSKADIELSVSLTAISTALSILMTPFNFWLYGNLYIKTAGLAAEVPQLVIPLMDVLKTIFILLGLPLTLGLLTTTFLPKVAKVLRKPLQYFSIVFFLGMVVMLFAGNFEAFMQCIKYVFVVVLIHNLLAFSTGFGTATAFRLSNPDRRTLTIETGIQNSGLALVLLLGTSLFANFPAHGGALVIAAWWGVWHIVSGLTISSVFNLIDSRKRISVSPVD
ncbi:MAG: bile acid:sodium symporter family protein [Bacteroidales bacterium]|nr:bile acid:sodium symporter family protein [Bacteroidales bacterium]